MYLIVDNNIGNGFVGDKTAQDAFPINSLLSELVVEVFSHLNLARLGTICCVSKEWERLASTPILWKSAIFRELAFGNDKWAQCIGEDKVKDEDRGEEFSSLPLDIAEEYKKFQRAYPEKNVKDSLNLVRLPKTLNGKLSVKSVGELAKTYFSDSDTGYGYIWDAIVDELGDKSIDKSLWVLMTKDVLPGSRNKSYAEQQVIVRALAQKALIGYEIPETLEAIVCILAQYFDSKMRLFSDDPLTYTRCKEKVQGYQTIVGGFAPAGLDVDYDSYDGGHIGVAALRKF